MFNDALLPISNFIKQIAAGTATYQLTPKDRTVEVLATDSSGHITVVLPSAAECFGLIFSIRLITKATSDVVVKSYGSVATLATIDTSGDDAVLYCDGREWHLIGGTYT